MIPDSIIEEIKYRNDIEDVISSYVTLKRSGSNMSGLCPFHSEKTPSFTVFTSGSNFYCFGCGAGGDVITFIMRIENLDYIGAVEFLAKRAGITLPQDDMLSKHSINKQRIIDMNQAAAKFFHNELIKSKIAMDYLGKRGLSTSIIRRFGLGYAPDGFGNLTNYMHSLNYTNEELSVGFLCGLSKNDKRPYDYFRNRVIFPIIDVSSNVIGFGGRVLDDSMPKYLNSSDTPAFKKSRNLFALNFAKNSCSETLILCEGYMDVISLHSSGFENSVATLGTAMTSEQARIMKRYTKRVIISYDSDDAGQNAADKAFRILGEAGLEARILRMEGAKDPDEYIKKYGSERFKLIIDNSSSRFDFKFDNLLKKYNIENYEEKIKAANEIAGVISSIYSAVEREVYIFKVSAKLEILPENLKNDVDRIIKKKFKEQKRDDSQKMIRETQGYGDRINPDFIKNQKGARAEEAIIGILLLQNELIKLIKDGTVALVKNDFVTEFSAHVFESILECRGELGLMGADYTPDEMGRITKMKVSREGITNNKDILIDCITTLKNAKPKSLDEILKKQEGNNL